jgi:hypothetical protein
MRALIELGGGDLDMMDSEVNFLPDITDAIDGEWETLEEELHEDDATALAIRDAIGAR